ncbi:MAG: hypothetical protein LUO93_11030 [Methanomicrobiales archaeon]|nr:hypothetical protein [Methanomicrobiales archaeon]
MAREETLPIDIRNVGLLCDSLYARLEKEIIRLKLIARNRQGDEKKFVTDLIRCLEQEEGDYFRTRSVAT